MPAASFVPNDEGRGLFDFGFVFERRLRSKTLFNSAEWLTGEADRKVNEDGREIWACRVDLGSNSGMPFLPVTFDRQTGTFAGRLKG